MITVLDVTGLATVQDGGRPGHMHEGVPPGGPLVPELLARANAAVGNEEGAAGLEVVGALTLTGPTGTLVAADDGIAVELDVRSPWRITAAGGRVRYVAVQGGIDVPRVLGGRGTLLGAAFGGHEGRALRRGDVLPVGEPGARRKEPPPPAFDLEGAIRVVTGPDLDRFDPHALALLLSNEYRVDPRSDRVGIRLTGPVLIRAGDDLGPSAPMVRGALQVPSSGAPIVLGPDHPTTGGYPVLATVVAGSLGAIGARPVGAAVRFVLAG
ncbi:MAG TPA: biotin-dependent carboxyltransferase family protein [Polyangiaceae bacterium]